jgi:hypothetical protein
MRAGFLCYRLARKPIKYRIAPLGRQDGLTKKVGKPGQRMSTMHSISPVRKDRAIGTGATLRKTNRSHRWGVNNHIDLISPVTSTRMSWHGIRK